MYTVERASFRLVCSWTSQINSKILRRREIFTHQSATGRQYSVMRRPSKSSYNICPLWHKSSFVSLKQNLCHDAPSNVTHNLEACLAGITSFAMHRLDFPPELCHIIISDLSELQYTKLYYEIPWLETTKGTAYIQLNVSRKLNSSMAPIVSNPGFQYLLENIEKNINYYSPNQKVDIYNHLLLLSVSKETPLMHCLFSHILSCIDQMDLNCLSGFAVILSHLPRGARIISMHAYRSRFKELYRNVDGYDSLYAVAEVVNYTASNMTHNLVQDVLVFLVKTLQRLKGQIAEPRIVCELAVAGQKLRPHVSTNLRPIIVKYMELTIEAGLHSIDQFESNHVAILYAQLKKMRMLSPEISSKIRQRCHKIIEANHNIRIFHLANLQLCLGQNSPFNVVECALYLRMDDVDLVTLCQISQSYDREKKYNLDILCRFEQLLIQRCQDIPLLSQDFRVRSLMRFLNTYPPQDLKFHSIVRDELLKNLRTNLDWIVPWPAIISFLFSSSKSALPQTVFHKVLDVISTFSVVALSRVMTDWVEAHFRRGDDALQKQINQVEYGILYRLLQVSDQFANFCFTCIAITLYMYIIIFL